MEMKCLIILDFIIENINDFGLFVGSHNEKSNRIATELLKNIKLTQTIKESGLVNSWNE